MQVNGQLPVRSIDRVHHYWRTDRHELSSGVPQGSVLGPTLWNVLYNDLLDVRLPLSITSIAFLDDIALVSKAKENFTIEKDLTEAAKRVCDWLKESGLQIAAQKSEVLVITNKRTHTNVDITVEGTIVHTNKSIRYLGVQIDSKLSFTDHARIVSAKASIRMPEAQQDHAKH